MERLGQCSESKKENTNPKKSLDFFALRADD